MKDLAKQSLFSTFEFMDHFITGLFLVTLIIMLIYFVIQGTTYLKKTEYNSRQRVIQRMKLIVFDLACIHVAIFTFNTLKRFAGEMEPVFGNWIALGIALIFAGLFFVLRYVQNQISSENENKHEHVPEENISVMRNKRKIYI